MLQRNDSLEGGESREGEVEGLAYAVMSLVDTAHRRISATIDLTRVQIIGLVSSDGPWRPSDIAQRLQLTKSTVSRQLSALQDAGQITVKQDPRDARTFLVEVTEQGDSQARATQALGARRFGQVISDWTDEEVRTARRSVEHLLQAWATPAPLAAAPGKEFPPDTASAQPRWMRRRINGGNT